MGKPTTGNAVVLAPESIGCVEASWGTETSKYPGKERNLDSLSSGERKGKSPNRYDVIGGSRCRSGVVGLQVIRLPAGRRVTKLCGRRSAWNCTPQRVTAP